MDPTFIATFCTHSITVKSPTASDVTMDETLGPARTCRGYYEKRTNITKQGTVTGAPGVVSTPRDVFITPDAVYEDDRYWRAGEDTSNADLGHKVKSVAAFTDHTVPAVAGVPVVDHYEVEL